MTEKELSAMLQQEFQAFCDSRYNGKPIDELLWDRFLKSLMIIPPSQHKASAVQLTMMKAAGREKLTFVQAGLVLNCINAVPFEKFTDDLDAALRGHEALEAALVEYNRVAKAEDARLASKRDFHMKMVVMPHKQRNVRPLIPSAR